MRFWEAPPPRQYEKIETIPVSHNPVDGHPLREKDATGVYTENVLYERVSYISIDPELREIDRINPWRVDHPTLIALPGGNVTDDADPNVSAQWRDLVHRMKDYVGYFKEGMQKRDSEQALMASGEHIRDGFLKGHSILAAHIAGVFPRITPEEIKAASILLVSYKSVEEVMTHMRKTQTRHGAKSYFSDESMQFVTNMILPLLGDIESQKRDDGWVFKRYNKKPLRDILEQTKYITLQGTSVASSVFLQVDNALKYALERMDFSPEEIKQIRGSIIAYGTGNVGGIRYTGEGGMTIIQYEGINDILAKKMNPAKMKPHEVSGMKSCYFDPKDPERSIILPKPTQFYIHPIASNRLLCLVEVPPVVEGLVLKPRGFVYDWIGSDLSGHHVMNQSVQGDKPNYAAELLRRISRNAVYRGEDRDFKPEMPINPYRLLAPAKYEGAQWEVAMKNLLPANIGNYELNHLIASQLPPGASLEEWHHIPQKAKTSLGRAS